MLIATKYEEIYPPELKDFTFVADNSYTEAQLLKMEYHILRKLNFEVTTPSSFRFSEFLIQYTHSDSYVRNLSAYILELALLEYKLLKYRPSLLASSAVYLSSKILRRSAARSEGLSKWGGTPLEEVTNYSEREVRDCAKDLCLLFQGSERCSLQAV